MLSLFSTVSRVSSRPAQNYAKCLKNVRCAHILRDDPDDSRQTLEVKLSFHKNRSDETNFDGDAINIAKKDPDNFGTSAPLIKLASEDLPDDDDGYDKLEKKKSKRSLEYYDYLFSKTLQGFRPDKVQRGIKLLEQMHREDRIRPGKYHYSMLLAGCRHLGLAEQAFELFRQQFDVHRRKRETLPPSQPTSLFNACAQCESSVVALEKARYFREHLYERGFQCNYIHYNAMIKVFSRHGDMQTALSIVKEMAMNKISINAQTYAMLLMGCITDKEAGLAHAIRIVRQMKRRRVPLEIHTFNLLLRCVRDCNVGSKENLRYLFREWSSVNSDRAQKRLSSTSPQQDMRSNTEDANDRISDMNEPSHDGLMKSPTKSSDIMVREANEIESVTVPNLLKELTHEQRRNLVDFDFKSLSEPASRLYLIGGLDGVCQMMRAAKVKPTAATATQLLDSLPSDTKFEIALITNMEDMGVRFDTDFYNMLIKRRCFRKDFELARHTLSEMQNDYLYLDIVTFGVLALGCATEKQGISLINDMKRAGFKLNKETIGATIKNASFRCNFDYLLTLLKIMKAEGISAEPILLENISIAIDSTETMLLDIERGNKEASGQFLKEDYARPCLKTCVWRRRSKKSSMRRPKT